eukprot:7834636-Pyramimonas_sp.AAC.1
MSTRCLTIPGPGEGPPRPKISKNLPSCCFHDASMPGTPPPSPRIALSRNSLPPGGEIPKRTVTTDGRPVPRVD